MSREMCTRRVGHWRARGVYMYIYRERENGRRDSRRVLLIRIVPGFEQKWPIGLAELLFA